MTNKKILIISIEFAPSAAISGKRATKLAIKMQDCGWSPYVLTLDMGCYHSYDLSLAKLDFGRVHIERLKCRSIWQHSRSWSKDKKGLSRFLIKGCRAIVKLTQDLLPTDEWYPWSILATTKAVSLVKKHNIDLIWATSPPLGSIDLAYRVSQRTSTPYIVDFRDVRYIPDLTTISRKTKKQMWYERRVLESAAGISFTSPNQIKELVKLYPSISSSPSHLAYNWYEKEKWQMPQQKLSEGCEFFYGGSLYGGNRRIDKFFEALARMKLAFPDVKKEIAFMYFGPDANYLEETARKYNISDIVASKNRTSEGVYRQQCIDSNVLLLVIGHDSGSINHSGAIPAKLYDYFAAGKPVLVIGPQNCVAGEMVTQLKRGLFAVDDDVEGIFDAITKLKSGRFCQANLNLSDEAVERFQDVKIVSHLSSFFDSVIGNKDHE